MNITSEAIRGLDSFCLLKRGTLICAPRREGKSTFLASLAASRCMPPTIVVPNRQIQRCLSITRSIIPSECEGAVGDLCIDEIGFIWSNQKLVEQIPWSQVICATTSSIDFDRIQAASYFPGMAPEYDWIRHLVIVLPTRV